MNKNKKYVLIVTEEDERYENGKMGLIDYTEAPWEGNLVDIVFGDTYEELFKNGEYEGLFYQLYIVRSGEKIGYGLIDYDYPKDIIEKFNKKELERAKEEIKTPVLKCVSNNLYNCFDKDKNILFTLEYGVLGVLGRGNAWRLFFFYEGAKTLIACFTTRDDGNKIFMRTYKECLWSFNKILEESNKLIQNF